MYAITLPIADVDTRESVSLSKRIAQLLGSTPYDRTIMVTNLTVRALFTAYVVVHLAGFHASGVQEGLRLFSGFASFTNGWIKLIQCGDRIFDDRPRAFKALRSSLIWFVGTAVTIFL